MLVMHHNKKKWLSLPTQWGMHMVIDMFQPGSSRQPPAVQLVAGRHRVCRSHGGGATELRNVAVGVVALSCGERDYGCFG